MDDSRDPIAQALQDLRKKEQRHTDELEALLNERIEAERRAELASLTPDDLQTQIITSDFMSYNVRAVDVQCYNRLCAWIGQLSVGTSGGSGADVQISTDGLGRNPHIGLLMLRRKNLNSLEGLRLPPGLFILHLDDNPIRFLDSVSLPKSLCHLDLSGTRIVSLNGVALPLGLETLNLKGTPIADDPMERKALEERTARECPRLKIIWD